LEAFKAWRQDNHNAVLIVDQFEELFTQNTEEEQRRFAEIVGRVALDADVHVLVSMRDDFLMRCHPHEQLRPMFSELTGLDPPHGSALRRAVVQPALRCGYRFEDEELADEILAEVEGERGALPLLAFALARLWEKRDRENGLITRQAHRDIGGVGGALARHAEALMERLGPERHGIVREIFRNLVTAQGTRVARDTDELLSVFHEPQREVADEVLRELIDDRLLTSYEAPTEDGPGRQRVEIIHESLLRAWPRLVRWQAQDAEGALLRDQLRQAAQTWQEHGSSDDVLWTGSAYREFAVWRERYTGGLSELEEAFARAMTVLATRRRRRRRIAVAAVITALAVGLTVVGSLWRRSVLQQLRADAATLLSQAQVELESYPSAALAYATASLELSDTEEARLLALEALWKGPTALVVNEDRTWMSAFTPDGRWLVQPIDGSPNIRLVAADGSHNLLDRIDSEDTSRIAVLTDRESGLFLSSGFGGERQSIGLWSAPEGRLLAKHFYESDADLRTAGADSSRQRCLMVVVEHNGEFHVDVLGLDGSYQRLGTVNLESETADAGSIKLMREIFPDGRIWATRGHDVFAVDAGVRDLSRPRRMFRQESLIRRFDVDPLARFVATTDEKGVIRLWDIAGSSGSKVVDVPAQERTESVRFTRDGSLLFAITTSESEVRAVWLWTLDGNGPEILRRLQVGTEEIPIWVDPVGLRVAKTPQEPKSRVWSLMAPADAGPLILAQGDTQFIFWPRFSPDGRWFATAADDGLIMWPLDGPHPIVIRRHKARVRGLAFGPDGRWLASASWDGTVRMWPLTGSPPPAGRIVFDGGGELSKLVATADGDRLLVGTENSGVWEMSPATGDSHKVPFFEAGAVEVAFSPDGRLAAAVGGQWFGEKGVVRVWDVASGDEVAILDPRDHRNSYGIEFIDNDVLLTANESVLRRWDLETGETDVVYGGPVFSFVVSEDGQRVVINEFTQDPSAERISSSFVDLATGDMIPLESHGNSAYPVALNAPGTVVATGGVDGIIRVGPTTGQEPQLLLGHEGGISALAVDPRERWIASGGKDGTVRLWPMPDLSKPPLHTLPRAELIAKLKTLTNLRAVRDEESATGWTLTHDPFPGWETVPTW
jgi:WD40 repeat protein